MPRATLWSFAMNVLVAAVKAYLLIFALTAPATCLAQEDAGRRSASDYFESFVSQMKQSLPVTGEFVIKGEIDPEIHEKTNKIMLEQAISRGVGIVFPE